MIRPPKLDPSAELGVACWEDPAPLAAALEVEQPHLARVRIVDPRGGQVPHGLPLVIYGPAPAEKLTALSRPEWIHATRRAISVDLRRFAELGDIWLSSASPAFHLQAAEDALFFMLGSLGRLGSWHATPSATVVKHSDGATLARGAVVIVGMGWVGRAVARLARRLGLEVRVATRQPRWFANVDAVAPMAEAATLVVGARWIVAALPAPTPPSPILDAGFLQQLEPGTTVVSVGSSAACDLETLASRCAAGELAVAASAPDRASLDDWSSLAARLPFPLLDRSGDPTPAEQRAVAELFLRRLYRVCAGLCPE